MWKDAFDDIHGYRRGIGRYRKHFTILRDLRAKQIFIKFEGVNQVADVWLKGSWIRKHVGGYTAFAFDLTPYLNFDKEIAVRVDIVKDINNYL